MTVWDSISESLFEIFAFATSVDYMKKNVYESYVVIAACGVM